MPNTNISASGANPIYKVVGDAVSVNAAANTASDPLLVESFSSAVCGVVSNSANFRRNIQLSFDGTNWFNHDDTSSLNSSGGAYYSRQIAIGGAKWLRVVLYNNDATAKTFDAWVGLK